PSVLIVGGCISTGSQRAQLTAAQRVLGRLLSASNGAFVRARVVEDLGAASRQGGEVALGPRQACESRILHSRCERIQVFVAVVRILIPRLVAVVRIA